MTQKITLSSSRDIPLNKLVLSQSNVRRVKSGISVEQLAADIARRGLLQSLNVRPVLKDGLETGMFEVPADGRRFQALQLLVKQKRLATNAPVPCVVREASTEIMAEDDSLAENVQRVPLHPLDQFRAFKTLRDKGMSDEDIAAAFFVAVSVVKQRLRLACWRLLAWRADGLLLGHMGTRSVATARMPDHDLVAAPFVERYFTTGPASIVAPIVTLPIISVLVETVRPDAEARDFDVGRDSILGGCWESPHCTRDGGDKR
jgi:ParB-like nuclease domain